MRAPECVKRRHDMVDGEFDKTLAVAAAQLLDHRRVMFARVREQLRIADAIPADAGRLDPQLFNRFGEVLVRAGRPDAPVKCVVEHVHLQQIARIEFAAILGVDRLDFRERLGLRGHGNAQGRFALQNHADLVNLLDLGQREVAHDHAAIGPPRDEAHSFELHERCAQHVARHPELRADLLFDEPLMRPQTANDDVRLDALDQLRCLCVRPCNQALSLASLLCARRRACGKPAYSHMTRILPVHMVDSIGVYLENN